MIIRGIIPSCYADSTRTNFLQNNICFTGTNIQHPGWYPTGEDMCIVCVLWAWETSVVHNWRIINYKLEIKVKNCFHELVCIYLHILSNRTIIDLINSLSLIWLKSRNFWITQLTSLEKTLCFYILASPSHWEFSNSSLNTFQWFICGAEKAHGEIKRNHDLDFAA